MGYRGLYIFVEGNTDAAFFAGVIVPLLETKYEYIKILKYAEQPNKRVVAFLQSIQSIKGADYIFITDINAAQCITAKKQIQETKYRNIETNKTFVVIKEIESWYLAGVENIMLSKYFKISALDKTDNIDKEHFNKLIPKKFSDSRINFLQELLKHFSIEAAMKKNKSFKYFAEKIF